MQILALIGGLFRCRTIRNALVVCPVSVVQSWEKEAKQVFDLCGLSSTASVMVVDKKDLIVSLDAAMEWYEGFLCRLGMECIFPLQFSLHYFLVPIIDSLAVKMNLTSSSLRTDY